ncbi:MAG: hypothetical protein QXV73_05385 [Candidatus Micrarchaeia archaeon]
MVVGAGDFEDDFYFVYDYKALKTKLDAAMGIAGEALGDDIEDVFRGLFGVFVTREDIIQFVETNVRDALSKIIKQFKNQFLPDFYEFLFSYSIKRFKEFDIDEYRDLIHSASFIGDDYFYIDVVKNYQKNTYKIEVNVNEDALLDLTDYSHAIVSARNALGVGDVQDGIGATYSWTKYYQCAREGRRIYAKRRKKGAKDGKEYELVDVTQKYIDKYWETIRMRKSFFPPYKIPFFAIMEFGNENISLLSDKGGKPYPSQGGLFLLDRAKDLINQEIESFKEDFFYYLEGIFPAIQVETPSLDVLDQRADDLLNDFIEKGVIRDDSQLVMFYKTLNYISQIDLEDEIREYARSLGYEKCRVEIFTTKSGKFSLRIRMPDGRFAEWRGANVY